MTAKHEIKSAGAECETFKLIDDAVYIKVRTGHFIYIDQSIDGEITVSAWNLHARTTAFDHTLSA